MSNEARIQASLQVKKGNLTYQSLPSGFQADIGTAIGPTPGAILVATTGTNVDFSQLTTPGLCRIMNLDSTNYVSVGSWHSDLQIYIPLFELLPGESFVLRLYRFLGEEFDQSGGQYGTGSPEIIANKLRLQAQNTACEVLVEAFNK